MAAGERAAAQSASAYEGGGVGGKFRKRPFRRTQTTPYERPPTALRNRSWLSKLVVDPATRLLAAGAQRFFASVFRKRLQPPPQPLEEKQESRDRLQETVPDNSAGPQEPADNVADGSIGNNNISGISDLEQLLKQKTFTRSEIEHLSELLHSRAVDISVKDDGIRPGANLSTQNNSAKPMLDTGTHLESPITLEENKIEKGRTKTNKLVEDEIASPMELAKAYMGTRPSQVSPSTLPLRGQSTRDDAALLNNSLFASKLSMSSNATKTTAHVRIPENGFATPRSHGRSAIYNMARTPYSRVNLSPMHKVSRSGYYGYSKALPSSSQPVWDNGEKKGSEPTALKRRSSVLDDDIESVRPVRRIRQKPNLLSHGICLPSCGMSLGSDATHLHKVPLIDETKNRASNTPSTSYAHVPPESGEMAARIFEHLEKMTPKEKSTESKLAAARERASFKLTPNMLHGQALKSLEDLDASKLLQNSQNDHKLWDKPISSSRDSTTLKQGLIEENGSAKSVRPLDKLDAVVNTDTTASVRDIKLTNEDASIPKFIPEPSERRQGFKMSAHEDSFELDDDEPSNEPAARSAEESGLEKSMMDSKSIAVEGQAFGRTLVSCEVRTPPVPVLSKRTELDTSSASMNGEEHTAPTFSLLHASTRSSQSALPSQSALAPDSPATAGDSPLFLSFGSKAVGNVPSSTEPKAESSSSLMNISTVATDAKFLESDRSNTKSSHLLDGTAAPSRTSSSASTISISSAGAPFSNLGSNNGTVASSASILSSSCDPVSLKLGNQNFTNHSSEMVSSTGTTIISTTGSTSSTSAASDSGLFVADVAPSISPAPVLNLGSSKDPSNAISAASTTANAETTGLKVNAEKENGLGRLSNSSLGSTTFAAGSTSSSIFGLGSFVSSSAANNQLQGSDTASGSGASTASSSAESGTATVSQTVPVQFGSSSSSTVFGASGITSFTSSNIFGSSAPATSAQSSASMSETNLLNSSTGGTPSIFKFGVGSSASSEVNAISTSSTATPGIFNFGVNSAASTTSNSSFNPGFFSVGAGSLASSSATSSSSTPGILSFGASSSVSSLATSGSSTSGIFSFGSSSLASSSPANNAVISSSGTAPSIFSFGSSVPASTSEANSVSSGDANSISFGSDWKAPKSPIFGSTFSTSSPSTGFSFGASSSSFGTANASPMVFGSTTGASPSPVFSFSASPSTTSPFPSSSTQTVFGSTNPFAASPGNNDQMNTEDSMVEDPVQSSTPAAPVFGQAAVSPSPPGIMFGSTVPSPAPFQFGGQQQNQAAPQNPLQVQQSGSLEFNAGGSFSLGSSGGDKSGRKFFKASRNRNKKR